MHVQIRPFFHACSCCRRIDGRRSLRSAVPAMVDAVTGERGAVPSRDSCHRSSRSCGFRGHSERISSAGCKPRRCVAPRGLRVLSELLGVPVVGITEAALAEAGYGPVGAIIFGASSSPLYQRLMAGYGCEPTAWESIEFASRAKYLNAKARDEAVLNAIERLAHVRAKAAAIPGAAIVGMAARLAPRAAIPISDGAAALGLCCARIAAGVPLPPKPVLIAESIGLTPALSALISHRAKP